MLSLRAPAAGLPRVAIAGGFTGGHIFCSLAIARALRARAPGVEVLIVGARAGMEIPIARAAGLPVRTVWLDGLERRLSAGAVARSALLPLKLGASLAQAALILRRFRPHVAVGVGAYVSFPVLAVAAAAGVPVLVHEANARPGIANQLLARVADVMCLGVAPAGSSPRARGRVVHTGNPIRAELAEAPLPPSIEARRRLGLAAERATVLVMGGSLGASRLNAWMLGAGARFAASPYQVLWQTGRAHLAGCRARGGARDNVRLVAFLDDMAAAYAAADLVVAGAGAMTLAELTCLGKPAIIVPDRDVSEDHQAPNGAAVRAGGGLVWDGTLDETLTARIEALLRDPTALRALGDRMRALAHPGAADRIAAEIVALAASPPD